jgi:prephenate dehydrogenase
VTRAAVVGLGLIGGALALALRARGYDRDASVRERARERGIDALDSLEEAAEGAGVVVTAVSTSETVALLSAIHRAAPRAVLTDTASLKRPVVEAARGLPAGARFVAGHPMAGSHRHGVEAASAELFHGRPWVLCPASRSDDAALEEVSALIRAAGARPVLLDADRHDRLMTWASHLPLAAAAALTRAARSGGGEDLRELAGPGLLDTTRLAGQRVSLALELALADPEALADAIDALGVRLSEISALLRRGDAVALQAYFEAAAAACDLTLSVRVQVESP